MIKKESEENIMNEYSYNFYTYHSTNTASFLCYKSSRKNSSTSKLKFIHHLISHSPDKKVNDNAISNQFLDAMECIVNYAIQHNNHLEISAWVFTNKQFEKPDLNYDLYCGAEEVSYIYKRVTFEYLEQCFSFMYSIFYQLYPYNKLQRLALYRSPRMKQLVVRFYDAEKRNFNYADTDSIRDN